MGNCVQERKPLHTLFDSQELKKLNQTFDYYCDLQTNTRKNRQLSRQSFEEIFIENPEFGRKLFTFLERYGEAEKYIQRDVLFYILEVLLKDGSSVNELKSLTKVELFSLISLKSIQYIKNKDELHSYKITYLDAITILNDILRIRLNGDQFQNIDEKASRAFLDSVFKSENGVIEWFVLMKQIKTRLGGLSLVLKQYFKNKFMLQDMQIAIPQLNTNSYLLCEDLIFQLQLSAYQTKLKGAVKLDLLYSNLVHPGGFQSMVQSLIQSNLPTLILLQHEEKYQSLQDKSQILKTNVFGAISNQRWFDSAQPQGDNNDCLFSLHPHFIVYHPKKERTAKRNFCYLNSKDLSKPQGVGFGYDENGFRIWIDKDLKKTTCSSEDSTYESGDLVNKYVKKLNISVIEIWGIVHPQPEENVQANKVANAEPELAQFEDFYDDNQQVQVESKADYYWSNKQEEAKVDTVNGSNNFYWNSSASVQKPYQSNYQLTKSTPNTGLIYEQGLSQNDQLIAKQLLGYNEQNTYQKEQQAITVTRRSNIQRPVLDFATKSKSTYVPATTYEIKQSNTVDRDSFKQQIQLNDNIQPRRSKDEILNDQAYSQQSKSSYERGRKTADQIIQDYESRKAKKMY